MPTFNRIIIGEVDEKTWLMDALKDYINENPMVSDIELHQHFKMRIDILSNALVELRLEGIIERVIIKTMMYYRIFEVTEEDLQDLSLPTPFGNLKI